MNFRFHFVITLCYTRAEQQERVEQVNEKNNNILQGISIPDFDTTNADLFLLAIARLSAWLASRGPGRGLINSGKTETS